MSKHDPRVTLQQLRDVAHQAQDICRGLTVDQLRKDWMRTLAFERCFEVVGEAIKRLPMELRAQYPQVAWRKAAGARDKIAHGNIGCGRKYHGWSVPDRQPWPEISLRSSAG